MEKLLFLFVIALGGTRASTVNVPASRILEGTIANENQFRYMVSLQKISEIQSYTRGHRCGGALVTLQHTVTAASCNFYMNNELTVAINPAEYRVFSGAVSLTNDESSNRHRLITNITVHPNYYGSSRYVNDIAVIFLASPFSSETNTLVLLPVNDAGDSDLTSCYSSGWGAQNTTANASVQLMFLQKRIYDQANCLAHYSSQFNVEDTMVCASGSQQEQFAGCRGDVGNPLVCSGYLIGVLIRTKNCTVSAYPEVYTRISSYNRWINDLLAGLGPIPGAASTFQPGMAMLAVIVIAQIITAIIRY